MPSFISFLEFLDKNAPSDMSSVVTYGGFIPGQRLTGSKFTEANDEDLDVQTYSKAPILFNQGDIVYLMQFPPKYWGAALKQRYNDLLFRAKQDEEDGRDPREPLGVTLPDRNTSVTFDGGNLRKDRPPGHGMGIVPLLKWLERPRNLDALSTMDKENAESYKGGLYGFDLGNQKSTEKENFGNAYIGMTDAIANDTIKDWRNGVLHGWLGNLEGAEWKHVGLGGGKPSDRYVLDQNGTPIKVGDQKGGLLLPVYTRDYLAKYIDPSLIGPDGEVTFKGKRGGGKSMSGKDNDFEIRSHIPVTAQGKLIQATAVRQYDQLLTELNKAMSEGQPGRREQLIQKAMDLRTNAEKFNAVDWNIHRYNQSVNPETGKRLYPRLHTVGPAGVATRGGVHVLGTQKEQIKGKKKDWDTLTKHFISGKVVNGRNMAQTPSGDLRTSAIERGVGGFISSKKGTFEGEVLGTMYDDLSQEATMHVMNQTGDPFLTRYAQVARGEAEIPPKWASSPDHFYQLVDRKIQRLARDFTQEVWQMDWGRGTRRKRMQQGITSLNSTVKGKDGETEFQNTLSKSYRPSSMGDTAADDAQKRASGERTDLRRAGGLYNQSSSDSYNRFIFGHSLETIKTNLSKIQGLQKERDSHKDKSVDDHQSIQNLQSDVTARKDIFEAYLGDFIAKKLEARDASWNMNDAYEYARAQTVKILREGGVKVSDYNVGGKVSPAAMAEQEQERKEILAAAGLEDTHTYKGDEAEKQIFDPATLELLKNNPAARMRMKQMADQETDPEAKAQMYAMIDRVEQELGLNKKAVAATQQAPAATVGQQPQTSLPQVDFNSEKLLQNVISSPEQRQKLAAIAAKSGHPGLMALLQKAKEAMAKQGKQWDA